MPEGKELIKIKNTQASCWNSSKPLIICTAPEAMIYLLLASDLLQLSMQVPLHPEVQKSQDASAINGVLFRTKPRNQFYP